MHASPAALHWIAGAIQRHRKASGLLGSLKLTKWLCSVEEFSESNICICVDAGKVVVTPTLTEGFLPSQSVGSKVRDQMSWARIALGLDYFERSTGVVVAAGGLYHLRRRDS